MVVDNQCQTVAKALQQLLGKVRVPNTVQDDGLRIGRQLVETCGGSIERGQVL